MEKKLKIVKTEWEPKPCDICGSDSSVTVRSRLNKLPTDDGYYEFRSETVICNRCGFLFNKLRPDNDEFLRNYYRDTIVNTADDYKAGKRLELLNKVLIGKKKLVYEIGSGNDSFAKILRGESYEVYCYDIISDAAFVSKTVSAVLAYYVLEHVPDPRRFIRTYFNKCLKDGDYAIIEVPNFNASPEAAMHKEHFLYFTANHLIMLMMTENYQVLRVVHGHSRDFGMAVVARRGMVQEAKARLEKIKCQD